MFGQLIPPHWDAKIAVHFAHRVGALVVTLADPGDDRSRASTTIARGELRRPSLLLLACSPTQITLGALTVLSRKAVHHQLAARRHRRVGAGDVAGADAARASREICAVADRS